MVAFLLPMPIAAPIYKHVLSPLTNFIELGIPAMIPTPMLGKLCWTINFQKCFCWAWCLGLMHYYGTWDHAPSWMYLSMHGTYGMLWCLKELIFPDMSWQKPSSLLTHIIAMVVVLAPYYYFSWSINANRTPASFPLMAICNAVHCLGCVLMMAADSQKHYVLKAKKGLITDGWFAYCRNTNYLGEMMIYGSYAALSQDWISWAILVYVWGLAFGRNMMAKEERCMKKPGGPEYIARSGLILPDLYSWLTADSAPESTGVSTRSKKK
ncbi:hypothetical protein TeGR_g6820 [Tetraparma gracilis]|uniref:Steroid 5-alpha reductase C-terminal domain-containing protein n=1 Tax=Tetraparma gracilis TaxID=2962635 RepID=A0ABQ6N9C2_9STRA|nr:hypothetical protein TeGR_g6820 [Tetraparma gracilis]